jgi:hypothetical protein
MKSNEVDIFGVTGIRVTSWLNHQRSFPLGLEINLVEVNVETVTVSRSDLAGVNDLATIRRPIKGGDMPICRGNELCLSTLESDYIKPAELVVLVSNNRIIARLPSSLFL